ncbi:putative colanic acid biosynthesis acetyltransferase [Devosia sp. BK]|uniref:putative colanic acid biosynthesis acetyltransferase n=1 Tax=Devosia sp. BK TaxID=2871706 RepID=UPI00293B2153|nr:putative colanic acid biosynthesis acetyltransferase [Devosia sp. BK]MDV3253206.1 putative colanic acid biosynthesis acetyltransferase [Devosia sp. BK]
MTGLAKVSYPLHHRLFRLLWLVSWTLFAAWTPTPLHRWRCLVLRLFGARVGRDVRIHGSAKIWYPPNLVIEDEAVVGWNTVLYCQAPIRIGHRAIVSQHVHLIAATHDVDCPDFSIIARPIEIDADAWIAARATVGPGVTIGQGAVLGAASVAFSNLESWTIYAGNPARPLRRRAGAITNPWPDAPHERPQRHAHSLHR